MIEAGLCTVLASDYFYPALAPAAFRLWRDHGVAHAWGLVSSSPAEAVGLADRGTIRPGMRADLALIEAPPGSHGVRVLATVSGGHAIVQHRDGASAFTTRRSRAGEAVAA
jgi:alpha-D-ribose 1-methylphosphonate 5-triphosphate diphosphatase